MQSLKSITTTAILALLMLSACSSEPPANWGVEVDGQWIPVFDLHTHTGEWDYMPPAFQNRLSERVPTGFKWSMGPVTDWILSPDSILGQMNSAGIYGAGVFALYSPHTTGLAPNDFVSERVMVNPDRLYGFASIRTDRWNENSAEQLAEFERGVQLPGMVGVKLAHAHQQMRFDDERFYPIYEIAGRYGKPMYLHTGTSPNPGTRYEPEYADALYLEEAVKRYPKAIFILGHTGYDTKERALTYVDSAIYMAATYDNVYLEPGALGADRGEHVIDDFVTRLKQGNVLHKVIYGSDGVQFPGYLASHLENYVAAMKRNNYTADEMRQVLSGNFSRVFGIYPPGQTEASTEISAGE
ncbi:MAG: amidohydrolase [Gammaproteobacteria bacterium]|nr:MAG: amidohydrolase [Gammaproteobacteria bacterium]